MRRGGYQLLAIGYWFSLLLSATEPADVLRQHVVAQAKGGKLVLPVKSGAGKATPATILAADDNRLLVSAQGAELNLTWKMLGDDGLYELCQPLVTKAPGDVHAAYLQLAVKLGQADGPGFEKLLDQLWEKDPDAAKTVAALLKAPKKDTEPAKTQPAGKDAAKDSGTPGEKNAASDNLAALVGGIIGRDGKVNRDAYAREALSYDLLSLQRKLGPDYEYFHKSGKAEEFPTLPAATDKSSGKIGRNGAGFTFQFGTPVADPGGYWTTEGQVLYIPDKPNDHGVDRVDVASYGHHCLQFKPEHVVGRSTSGTGRHAEKLDASRRRADRNAVCDRARVLELLAERLHALHVGTDRRGFGEQRLHVPVSDDSQTESADSHRADASERIRARHRVGLAGVQGAACRAGARKRPERQGPEGNLGAVRLGHHPQNEAARFRGPSRPVRAHRYRHLRKRHGDSESGVFE
jgi:hypothetical protein